MINAQSCFRFILAFATGIALPAGAQATAVRVQCYRLEVSTWRPALGTDAPYHRVPPFIRLDTLPWPRGGRHLEPTIVYPGSGKFPETPRWEAAGDTVKLVWSNGYTPTFVTLVRHGDMLRGEAVAETDARDMIESPRPRASVTAHPVACAASRSRPAI